MTALAFNEVEDLVRQHVASEIVCQTMPGETSRTGCIMPLQYENGDSVVVWIEQWGDHFRVSDYGEAFIDFAARTKRDRTDLAAEAKSLAQPLGLDVQAGALVAQARRDDLGDTVWRTTIAAVDIARMAARFRRPHRRHGERVFVQEVEQEFRGHHLSVEREVKLEGSSGHAHRVTLYVALVEAVVEPIEVPAQYNQISAVYTKFGDLSRANEYQRFALVDDRTQRLSDDLANMLVQVSDVVQWTRRAEWMPRLDSAGSG